MTRRWRFQLVDRSMPTDANSRLVTELALVALATHVTEWRCRELRSRANSPALSVTAIGGPRWWETP